MSRACILVYLVLVTVVSLGAGCRVFSANMKDENPVEGARPSLSSREEASQEEKAAVSKDGGPEKGKKSVLPEEAAKAAEAEFKIGLSAERKASSTSFTDAAKKLYSEAEEHYFKAIAGSPYNGEYSDAWSRVALKVISIKECEAKLRPLAEKYMSSQPLAILYARVLERNKKTEQAIECLNLCLELNIGSLPLENELLLLYFRSGNVQKACDFYNWLKVNRYLKPQTLLVYGGWWNEMRAALRNGHRNVLPKDFNYTLKQCDNTIKEIAVTLTIMARGLNGDDNDDLTLICVIGRFLVEVDELELLKAFLSNMRKNPRVGDKVGFLLMMADTLARGKDVQGALDAAKMLENCSAGLDEVILKRLAEVLGYCKEPARAARVLEELVAKQNATAVETLDDLMLQYLLAKEYNNVLLASQLYKKPSGYAHYILGMAYKEKKDYSAAYLDLKRAERELGEKQGAFLYLELSMVCLSLKKKDEAIMYAEKAWSLDKEKPMLCNFFGYILADYGLRLELSQELIEKALKAEPRNVAYLDSLAWVLFRRGENARAEETMRRLLEIGYGDNGDEGEIQHHLGDILFANGKRDEAIKYWKEAAEKVTDKELKKTIEQKIKQ